MGSGLAPRTCVWRWPPGVERVCLPMLLEHSRLRYQQKKHLFLQGTQDPKGLREAVASPALLPLLCLCQTTYPYPLWCLPSVPHASTDVCLKPPCTIGLGAAAEGGGATGREGPTAGVCRPHSALKRRCLWPVTTMTAGLCRAVPETHQPCSVGSVGSVGSVDLPAAVRYC